MAAKLVRTIGSNWGRRPLHAEGVVDISALLTAEDIDRLIDSRTLRVSQLWVCNEGRNLPPSTYMSVGEQPRTRSVGSTADVRRIMTLATEGSPDPVKVAQHVANGASLTLNQVDQYIPNLRAMCEQFEAETHIRAGVILFVTPPSAQAFSLHADPHDIIVMQTHGTKQWEIHPTVWEKKNDPDAQIRRLVMKPGDMLYVPEGTPHVVRTNEDGLSIHQTIQFNVPRYDKVASKVLLKAFEQYCQDSSLAEPLPPLRGAGPQITERLAPSIAGFAEALKDLDLGALVEQHLESVLPRQRTLATGRLTAIAAADKVTAETPLRRAVPFTVSVEDGAVSTVFGRRRLSSPAHTEKYLTALAETDDTFTTDAVSNEMDAASRLLLCQRLVREGALTLA
ncbi:MULTISPECIES: JmjC domain-containing protein [unclassified Streptomyces]|uniref:JmjC domain-containing protein n=1 Tax=unclassified Streptomyces TaxID=2593676 RepID=UPI00131C0FCE|nr:MULTISPECIES: cupin domain-containing protein [unclassified Streptomyces]